MTLGYHQNITYWPPGTDDGYGGKVYAEAVQIKGRWEQRAVQFMSPQQTIALSNAVIFLPSKCIKPPNGADSVIEIEGYMCLGDHFDSDPTQVDGAFSVKALFITPDLRNIRNEVRVML